jgi:RNA polymerase sigma-70 factor (sigma-E family)
VQRIVVGAQVRREPMSVRRTADVTAFSEFVHVSSGRLFRTAYALVGDRQLAQDLLQEALVRTYVAWPRLRDETKAEAYTRRTIVTTLISWRRRRSFHERPVETIPDVAVVDDKDRLATQDDLWAQILLLPPRQRVAVTLRYCEDLTEADTAELMGCSVGTVKRQVSSGLAKLRSQMRSDAGPPPAHDEAVTR